MNLRADETLDTLLRGRLAILQGKGGYRLSVDAVLLARFVKIRAGKRVMDLGTGNGPIALMLAALYPATRVVGLEVQAAMARRARRNVDLNGLAERVEIIHGDVRFIEQNFTAASYDTVVANPPYRAPRSGRVNPVAEKQIARHEVLGSLADFLRAGAYVLCKGGTLAAVYPATRTVDLLVGLRHESIEPKRLRLVQSFKGMPASLVLVEGVKGGGRELEVMPPLVIYDSRKKYTTEMKALLEK